MKSNIDEAVQNVNIINTTKFIKSVDNTIIRTMDPGEDEDLYDAKTAPYHILKSEINKTYPLQDPKEFITYCNNLLSQKKFFECSDAKLNGIELLLFKNNSDAQILSYAFKTRTQPIIRITSDSDAKYAFFRSDESNQIDGIYLNANNLHDPKYLMTKKFYEKFFEKNITTWKSLQNNSNIKISKKIEKDLADDDF